MTHIRALHPKLVVEGAEKAMEFYASAFGAVVAERFTEPGGRVVHALVVAGPVRFALKDAGDGDPAPAGGGMPVLMALEVDDADAVAAAMLDGGAEVVYPVSDHDYGQGHLDRGGRLRDPFGHEWMLSQPLRRE